MTEESLSALPIAARPSRATVVLVALTAMALISIVLFMTLGAKGSWSFVLSFSRQEAAGLGPCRLCGRRFDGPVPDRHQ
jgi:hypothetical protein